MKPYTRNASMCIMFVFMVTGLLMPSSDLAGQNLPWQKYTTADGLPENRVAGLFEDSRGFLWLLSKNGITRFDGRNMIVYSIIHDSELLTPLRILEDRHRNIWIQTVHGVARYDGTGFTPFFFPEGSPITGLLTSSIYEDNEDNIWMHSYDSTGNNLLIRFNEGSYNIVNIDDERYRKEKLNSIYYHKPSDHLFIILGKDAYIWKNDTLIHFHNDSPFFLYDTDQPVIKTASGSYYTYENDTVHKITPTRQSSGRLTIIEPLEIIERTADSITVTDFEHKCTFRWQYGIIYDVMRDRFGTIWIGGEGGLYRLISDRFTIFDSNDGFLPDTWTLAEDNEGDIWFGTLAGTLKKYDGDRVLDMTHLQEGTLHAFTLGSKRMSDGRVWFTTFDGILEWDGEKLKKLDITEGQVEFIYEDTINGDIIMGDQESLKLVRQDTIIKFEKSSPEHIGYIRSICRDKSGTCWLVTEKSVYTLTGKKITELPDSVNNVIYGTACLTDDEGVVWIGGNNGLFSFNQTAGKMESALPTGENSPVKFIRQLDEKRIIAGRISDFILVNKEVKNDDYFKYSLINHSNGFTGSGCVQNGALIDNKGFVWILGNEIMARFDPGVYPENSKPPLLYVSNVDILSDELNWIHKTEINPYEDDTSGQVNLAYNENNVRVRLTGIYTRDPEGLLYSYMIAGQNQAWSEPSHLNTLVLPTLRKGKHEILFRASAGEGSWIKEPVKLILNVKPAFWQTNIFRILVLVFIIITGVFTGYLFSLSHRKRKDLQMKTVREYYRLQMGRFVQQFDPHFIFNVLSSISLFIEIGEKEEANSYLLKFSNLLRRIVTEEDYVRTLGEELDFIRNYCDMQKLIMEDKLEYEIITSSTEILKVHVPRMIIHNFVENAIRWGIQPKPEGGKVTIQALSNEEHIITIRDNGVGRNTNKNKIRKGTGKGLEVTKDLINVLNRNNRKKMVLTIEDLYDGEGRPCGTEVVIKIPLDFNLLEDI